jgi:hypothetical protein
MNHATQTNLEIVATLRLASIGGVGAIRQDASNSQHLRSDGTYALLGLNQVRF